MEQNIVENFKNLIHGLSVDQLVTTSVLVGGGFIFLSGVWFFATTLLLFLLK